MKRAFALTMLSAALLGCSSTVVRSGLAPGRTAENFDNYWHPAFLFGSVPLYDEYDLSVVCPEGWSEIHVFADEFTLGASLITAFLYSPSRITIICAAIGDPAPPPLKTYPVPTVDSSDPVEQ